MGITLDDVALVFFRDLDDEAFGGIVGSDDEISGVVWGSDSDTPDSTPVLSNTNILRRSDPFSVTR